MMNFTNKSRANYAIVLLIALTGIVFGTCKTISESEPGQSLGIASIPNLRDMGGYKTSDGATIARGLVFRSNQLYNISASDMLLLTKLNLKNDFDLRTTAERNSQPDELPDGVNNIWLDVMADLPSSGPANLNALLSDPLKANIELGNGKAEELFKAAYRHCISLPSAVVAYRELFLALGDENQLPVLFHCATGKDRTGWAAAAFLTFLGVPMEKVKEDYMRSNDYILPMCDTLIQRFVAAGGSPSIPLAILGVKEEYLAAAFDEMQTKYGSIENYFSEGLGINADQQAAMRNLYLKNE
ncbi:MAG: tyrosine-protein phosphatase [Bacteroidales bacterium]|nr:tyrosine-protein phosphatase [Bacteroidales bacterium]